MPHEIRIPRLGWSMEEGTFVGWLKQPGDEVAVGAPLFELEGDKALQEIESLDAGRLYIPPDAPQPGSIVPVGALVGYLLAPGEAIPGTPSTGGPTPAVGSAAKPIAPRESQSRSRDSMEQPIASPRARRIAEALGIDWPTLTGTGRAGRIREADVRAACEDLYA